MAYERVTGEECPSCHTLPEDWKDEGGKFLDEPVWTPVARTCPGCAEVQKLQKKIPDSVYGAYVQLILLDDLTDEDDSWVDVAEQRAREQRDREMRRQLGEP